MSDPHHSPDAFAVRRALEAEFRACELERPYARACYDPGDRLEYAVTGVVPANHGRVVAEVEKAVGGGFAGQVYRVRLIEVEGELAGLERGGVYAVKILTPPSAFSKRFRNTLYSVGYQGAFSAQVNPASVRVGVLWQKLIRRAMALELGVEDAVCDTFATFFDPALHSFGEINEWIDGRTWKYEVDDRLFGRWRFDGDVPADHNTPEYVHKKVFMRRLVDLLHEMGAPELARQYEWWTLKSQPNVLKRFAAGDDPAAGLTAVDFRAGLTLLPFLPMSPADGPLILRGLLRGRFVQFDRSDPRQRRRFFAEREEGFRGLEPAIAELEEMEAIHRASLPDVTGHHVHLIASSKLRRSVKDGTITAWQSLGRVDEAHADRLRKGWLAFFLVALLNLVPFFGRRLLELWGNAETRRHRWRTLTSFSYLWRALRGSRIETLIKWQRSDRLRAERVLNLVRRPVRFWLHRAACGWLPAKLHRALTDWSFAWLRLRDGVTFAYRFLRVPSFREDWLIEQVEQGRQEGMLTADEAKKVSEQIKDPYIQKYLRCLAVHLCTVPVTQVVMVAVGGAVALYVYLYQAGSWPQAMAAGTAAGALVQLSPISPGSSARGLFVIYLMIKERDIRNYYVAAPVAFIHVVGYLAFPMQMVTQNPALARFMAGRWSTSLTHVIPVFGEKGALLEHVIFDLFFNLPLSVRRGLRTRPVAWVTGFTLTAAALGLAAFISYVHLWEWRQPPVRLEGVTVQSIVPYYQSGGDLHWSVNGVRVHFEGAEVASGPVDYPADQWEEGVSESDRVDAVIRRSFFGDEYDGLAIARVPAGPGG